MLTHVLLDTVEPPLKDTPKDAQEITSLQRTLQGTKTDIPIAPICILPLKCGHSLKVGKQLVPMFLFSTDYSVIECMHTYKCIYIMCTIMHIMQISNAIVLTVLCVLLTLT